MKKRIVCAILCFAVLLGLPVVFASADSGDIEISSSFIDYNLKRYIEEHIDTNQDGRLSLSERRAVQTLNISGMDIRELYGIEHFSELKVLDCSNNVIRQLDLKANSKLTTLNCSNNRLYAVDISENKSLTTLICTGNTNDIEIGIDRTYSLSDLSYFTIDLQRVTGWTGADFTADGGSPVIKVHPDVTQVVYSYNCGNGHIAPFIFNVKDRSDTTYKVSFDANGGSGSMATVDQPFGRRLTLPECTFTPPSEDMFFIGWSPYPDDSQPYATGALLEVNRDLTIYAIWAKKVSCLIFKDGVIYRDSATAGNETTDFGISYENGVYTLNGTNLHSSTDVAIKIEDAKATLALSDIVHLKGGIHAVGELHLVRASSDKVAWLDLSIPQSAASASCAIKAKTCTIEGLDICSLTAGDGAESYGIHADEVTVKDSELLAMGSTAPVSYGIKTDKLTVLDVSALTVTGSSGAASRAPIVQAPAGYRVDVTASETYMADASGASPISNWVGDGSDDISKYKYLSVVASIYTVSFNAGDGSGEMANVTVAGEYALPSCTFTPPAGREFAGWSLHENGELLEGSIDVSKDLCLYAVWKEYPVIDEATFPDAVFREYVTATLDTDGDGHLSPSERASVTELKLNKKGITSFRGIELFTELSLFECSENKITELDLSKNVKLISLSCSNEGLTELDLSNNTMLDTLYCDDNKLGSLDLRKNTGLRTLSCKNNELVSLNVSGCTELRTLNCAGNDIISLNASGCAQLQSLICNDNKLASLDIPGCTELQIIICDSSELRWLDLSDCPKLDRLSAENNPLLGLDLHPSAAPSVFEVQTIPCAVGSGKTFDLSRLIGFDVSKTSNWVDATLNGTVMTLKDGTIYANYTYACGAGRELYVTLHLHGNATLNNTPSDPDCKTETNGLKPCYLCPCGEVFLDEALTSPVKDQSELIIPWESAHRGGTASCVSKAICELCQAGYGETDATNHASESAEEGLSFNETEHWTECLCGAELNKAAHELGEDGSCSGCKYQRAIVTDDDSTGPDNSTGPDRPSDDGPSDDDKGGLPIGATIAIVIAVIAVIAIGGGAVYWFVIKKKTLSDLIKK